MMNVTNWIDIGLHVLVGSVAVAALVVLLGVPPFPAAFMNTLGWFLREVWQSRGLKRVSRKPRERNPLKWSTQKTVEWVAPGVVGFAVAFVAAAFI